MKANEKLVDACLYGDLKSATDALKEGADVESDYRGTSILIWACQEGYENIVRLLVGFGANINAQDQDNETPLKKSIGENHITISSFLVDSGANVNLLCDGEGTVLHTACAYGYEEAVNLLLSNGADITIKDSDGKLPIDYARMYGHESIVIQLQNFAQQGA